MAVSMEFEIEECDIKLNADRFYQLSDRQVPIVNAKYLLYSNFFKKFMLKNVPCIIRDVANHWEATKTWISDGKPNLEYLDLKYKDTKVIIYNCSERYFNSQKCQESTLTKYLKVWKEKLSDNFYYLKDWHLKLQCKNDNFYEVPIYFASDWLNEYFTQCTDDDYRFVYMGQKGTWTPLHADVFNSYSWSVNVCGRKRWVFFPIGEEEILRDKLNNIPYDIEKITHATNYLEVIQNPGEAIFVPSGWYHQVWNLEDTISINHNWVNGCNINIMWQSLKNNLEVTKKEIYDCQAMDNFDEHCQTILNAVFGINYKQFHDFLIFIAKSRISMLNNKNKRVLFHGKIIGVNHIIFDLIQLQKVLEDFFNCDVVNKLDYNFNRQFLLTEIVQTLKNMNVYP